MRCPLCGTDDDKVIDSRSQAEGTVIKRRRECNACGRRFTTYEQLSDTSLMVIKRDHRREPFEREKISDGLYKACQKRPISPEQVEDITNEIQADLYRLYEKEVDSTVIGEMIMERLRKLDQVAYVRFASVYRQFKDVNEFMQELSDLLQDQKAAKKKRVKAKDETGG